MSLTKRQKRYLELAKRIAISSDSPDYRHGAVLVKGGSIINTSCNDLRSVWWANRFRNHQCGHATQHAEVGAVLGIARDVTDGAVMYVARVGKKSEFRLSKPCPMCLRVMEHVGIKKVIYTVDDEHVATIKLNTGLTEEDLFYQTRQPQNKKEIIND